MGVYSPLNSEIIALMHTYTLYVMYQNTRRFHSKGFKGAILIDAIAVCMSTTNAVGSQLSLW